MVVVVVSSGACKVYGAVDACIGLKTKEAGAVFAL